MGLDYAMADPPGHKRKSESDKHVPKAPALMMVSKGRQGYLPGERIQHSEHTSSARDGGGEGERGPSCWKPRHADRDIPATQDFDKDKAVAGMTSGMRIEERQTSNLSRLN